MTMNPKTLNPNTRRLPEYTTSPARLHVRAGCIADQHATRLVVSTVPFGQTAVSSQQQPNVPIEVGEDFLARVKPALGAWLILHANGPKVMEAGAFGLIHVLEHDPRGDPFL